jgi:hypothetical protein
LGHREDITLENIKTYVEMESTEENLSNLLYQVKVDDANINIRSRQAEIDNQKKKGTYKSGGISREMVMGKEGIGSNSMTTNFGKSVDNNSNNNNYSYKESYNYNQSEKSEDTEFSSPGLKLGSKVKKSQGLIKEMVKGGEIDSEEEEQKELQEGVESEVEEEEEINTEK